MPEPSKRVVLEGMGSAEKQFERLVHERLQAEEAAGELTLSLKEIKRLGTLLKAPKVKSGPGRS